MPKLEDWKNFKNILCIRPDNLGDVIMTSPAIKALKASTRERKITLLASRAGKMIAKHIPEIDEIIEFDPQWEKNPASESAETVLDIIEILKIKNFDAAIIFTVYSQNPLPAAMLCYLAEIPRVAGYCRENPNKLLTDWIPDTEPLYGIKHEVTRQLNLVEMLGCVVNDDSLYLTISQTATQQARVKLQESGVNPDEPMIVVHPGVSEAKRQYPINLFAKAAKDIAAKWSYQLLLTGVNSEQNLTGYIATEVGDRAFDFAGKLTIEELIAVIKMSQLVIANNTGPVHIAAAVKTPVVVLYALTNPQHSPWKVKHKILPFDVPAENRSKNVIIKYAYEKAFKKPPIMVQPEEIVKAVEELLKNGGGIEHTEIITV